MTKKGIPKNISYSYGTEEYMEKLFTRPETQNLNLKSLIFLTHYKVSQLSSPLIYPNFPLYLGMFPP
jgi:hypothetical protein